MLFRSKGPIKQWVPKSEIVNTTEMPKSKGKAKIMVPRQRLFKTYDRREVNVSQPHNERRRKCEVWRQRSLVHELLATLLSLLIMCGW